MDIQKHAWLSFESRLRIRSGRAATGTEYTTSRYMSSNSRRSRWTGIVSKETGSRSKAK
jgi:hypothetical protein